MKTNRKREFFHRSAIGTAEYDLYYYYTFFIFYKAEDGKK